MGAFMSKRQEHTFTVTVSAPGGYSKAVISREVRSLIDHACNAKWEFETRDIKVRRLK
jgi:hypothetical protein